MTAVEDTAATPTTPALPAGITDEDHVCRLAAFQADAHHGSMDRHPVSFHHDDIVQRQDHFLKVTEIAELVAARNSPHQDPVFLIIIKHGRERPEFVEDTLGDAEGVHGVGLAGQVFVFGHLKKVAQRMSQFGKTIMKIDQNDQRPDFRRITQPFPGFKIKKFQRVLPHPLKVVGFRPAERQKVERPRHPRWMLLDVIYRRSRVQASWIRLWGAMMK